jgi:hypothetical protein
MFEVMFEVRLVIKAGSRSSAAFAADVARPVFGLPGHNPPAAFPDREVQWLRSRAWPATLRSPQRALCRNLTGFPILPLRGTSQALPLRTLATSAG